MVGLFRQHPGDLAPAVAREIEVGQVKPTYEVRAWQDDDWWLARVVAASDNADTSPLNSLTQARSLAEVEPMARDLIATILDVDEDAFGVDVRAP